MNNVHFIIITYYFGTAELTGSRRWREMAQLLRAHGRVSVICADGPGEDCEGMEVLHLHDSNGPSQSGVFAGRPSSGGLIQYLRRVASSLLFWPDRQQGWARDAMQKLLSFILAEEKTFVITTGPIFSVHSEMARWVGKNSGKVRWVMDFRDLWTNEIAPGLQRRTPSYLTAFERTIEKKCHATADLVTTIGEGLARLLRNSFGSCPIVLYNGYLKKSTPVSLPSDGPVSIRYLGTIIPELRSPELLFQAASNLGLSPDQVCFEFWCNDMARIHYEASRAGVENLLKCHKAVTQREAQKLSEEAGANIILNALVSEADQVVTGKVFELIAAGRPIIAITGENSELRKILESCNVQSSVWSLKSACSALEAVVNKSLPSPTDRNHKYSRQSAVNILIEALAKL